MASRGGVVLFVAVVLGATASAEPAHACSAWCGDPVFFPARGVVPASLPHILFWPATRFDGTAAPYPAAGADVRLVRFDAAGPTEVPFRVEVDNGDDGAQGYRIVPKEPFLAGARYAAWARTCTEPIAEEPPRVPDEATAELRTAMPRASHALFDVTTTATVPTKLGAVTFSEPRQETLQLIDMRGTCAATRTVIAVDVVSDAVASPWVDAIAFSTYVDGQRYVGSDSLAFAPAYGSSWVGHGRDKLVAVCDPGGEEDPTLLSAGTHTLQFRGRIPGSDVTLLSDVARFDLPSCESADVPDAGEVDAATGGAGSGGGGGSGVAGRPHDGGKDGGVVGGGGALVTSAAPSPDEGACAFARGAASRGRSVHLVFVAALVHAARRRIRRTS